MGSIKSLLHPVPVVGIDINISHLFALGEQIEDNQYRIIDITETGGHVFVGMVHAAGNMKGNTPLTGEDPILRPGWPRRRKNGPNPGRRGR